MLELHMQGGIEYMLPLTILLLIILGLIGYVLYYRFQGKPVHPLRLELIRHTGMLALAWGVLSTMFGLYAMFKSLQVLKVVPPLPALMGGLQALLISLLYALIIFIISLLAFLLLKLRTKNVSQQIS